MNKLRLLDLFSGVGAYSLGLQRSGGFEPVAFCEIDPYCRRILARHWPHVRRYDDVRELSASRLRADGIIPDWIVAGWPCQDLSVAGSGSGLDGARSGLWAEIARLAGELRPEGLLLENSSNLLNINGGADFGRVLGDLAALGYDAEWHCLPAAAFDAPHIRDRLWIVATLSDANGQRAQVPSAGREPGVSRSDGSGEEGYASDAARFGRLPRWPEPAGQPRRSEFDRDHSTSNAHRIAPIGTAIARAERVSWEPEPDVVRVVHGGPNRVDRVRALGNLNPPIIPESIGRAIMEARGMPLQTEAA